MRSIEESNAATDRFLACHEENEAWDENERRILPEPTGPFGEVLEPSDLSELPPHEPVRSLHKPPPLRRGLERRRQRHERLIMNQRDKDREDARRAEQKRRDERRAMRGDPRAHPLNDQAGQEAARRAREQHTRGDQSWNSEIADLFGATPKDLYREFGGSSEEDKAARDAIKWVESAYTKGGKRKRAAKAKPKIDKARKAKKGCMGALVVLAGSATAAGWGLWEGTSALLGWS